ncbi:MAG TPA: iron chelate uptake ABC transporter family permease subunit, partial [Polyangiaceae bacterium]|nr:iron chelate uptake ABC transporter family permease subunit [Polyangiaceae bacterium]
MVLAVALGSGSAGLGDLFTPGSRAYRIVVAYRLPRVLLGAVSGAGLAAAGAALQSVLRNPLADPHILGVAGGAALGATVAIAAGAGAGSLLASASVPFASFAGGALATLLIASIGRAARTGGSAILLAGVVLNSIAYACILFVEAFADPGKLQSLVWWLMGYIDAPTWSQLALTAISAAVGIAILLADAARINVLALGDEPAASLGIEVRSLERRALFACAIVVGAV